MSSSIPLPNDPLYIDTSSFSTHTSNLLMPKLTILDWLYGSSIATNNKGGNVVKPIVKKNQANVHHVTGDKIPKSFDFSRMKLPGPVKQLQMDLRKLMLPYIALNLKEKKRNTLRDFLNVSKASSVLSLRVDRRDILLRLRFISIR